MRRAPGHPGRPAQRALLLSEPLLLSTTVQCGSRSLAMGSAHCRRLVTVLTCSNAALGNPAASLSKSQDFGCTDAPSARRVADPGVER